MTNRERISNAINFKPIDKLPLRIYAADGGLYEHGQKLVDLISECGHDFGDFNDLTLPVSPKSEDFDSNGRYHLIKTDDWGTTWEYRIFGIWGHPVAWPLNDLKMIDSYKAPSQPDISGNEFELERKKAETHKQNHYFLGEGGSLFEKMHSLRRFEDVLMDVTLNTPEINKICNIIEENVEGHIKKSLALDVDGITFGDDFGTESSLLLSPDVWRTFFKPRYRTLFDSISKAGKKVFFHCCGQVSPLLKDIKETGVDVLWPQLTVYKLPELAKRCRDLELALELHPDRGDLMQKGTPDNIRAYIYDLVETFDPLSGGSWLYIEIDPGFPWENVEALFKTVMELRD